MSEAEKEKWVKEAQESTDPIGKEVNRILTSRDPSVEVVAHLDNVIAGERENKLGMFRNTLSGKRGNPKKKVIILVKGTPGVGKTTLLRVGDFFKVKDVGRFSEHALDYADLSGYEVLRLKEVGLMDEEKQGVSTLKFLSCDDRGYTVEITVREKETGEFTTKEYKIPAMTLITSTTKVILDPQFERRAWIYNPDESPEQTERIKEWKAKHAFQEYEKSLGLRVETDEERSMKVLKRLVESLEDVEVIVPFPKTLFSILDSEVLRVRGDFDKLLILIENDALLLQRVLPSMVVNGKPVVFATPERAIQVLHEMADPLASMMLELEKRTRQLIEVLGDNTVNIVQKDQPIDKNKRNEIAIKMKKSEKTVRRYLDEWEDSGYLSSDNRKPKTYTLLYDLDQIKRKSAGILDKLKLSNELMCKMREEAQKWLRWQLDNRTSGDVTLLSKILEYYRSPEAQLSNASLGSFQVVQPERSSKDWTNAKCPMIQDEKPPEPAKPAEVTEVTGLKEEREGCPATAVTSVNKPDPFETRLHIMKAISELTKRLGYAQIANLEYETGIPQAELKNRLQALERDGSIVQFRPDCYRTVRG